MLQENDQTMKSSKYRSLKILGLIVLFERYVFAKQKSLSTPNFYGSWAPLNISEKCGSYSAISDNETKVQTFFPTKYVIP